MNPLLATDSFLQLIQALKYNQKAYTANALAQAAGVDVKFTENFIQALHDLNIFKFVKSPSGRLIRYRLNPFSTEIYYYDLDCIIKAGHTALGQYNCENYSLKYALRHQVSFLRDEAIEANKTLISYDIKDEQLVELLMCKLALHEEGTITPDKLADYPLVKARLKIITKKLQDLESLVAAEMKSNADKKIWFEDETQKAKTGKRQRVVSYNRGRQIGTSTVSRKVSASYWFGDKYDDWETETFPEYEMHAVMGAHYPDEPEYSYKMQEMHKNEISSLQYNISELEKYPLKYEKVLSEQNQEKIKALEKEKSRLDAQIKALSNV